MVIKVGDTIPEASFPYIPYTPEQEDHLVCGRSSKLNTSDWKGKKIVVVSVPGAFTPTCHANHLPGFIKLHDKFKAKGVDSIVVLSANDQFVLSGWGRVEGAKDNILFVSDTYAEWSTKLGLDVDLTAHDLGKRTGRYALIIDDLKVTSVDVEPNPGAVSVSAAEAILAKL